MKRLFSIILAFSLVLGLLPFSAFAAVDPQSDGFQTYLAELGMTEEEFVTYLESRHGYVLDDFSDMEDLKETMGPVLNEENLQKLLEGYGLTEEDLEAFLEETGASLEDYVYLLDLDFDLSNWFLEEELTPINAETLQPLLDDYGFDSKEELEAFLKANGDSIENYGSIEELEAAIFVYSMQVEKDDLINALDSFGLSLAEANNLVNHLLELMSKPDFNEEHFSSEMDKIANRLLAFPDFDSASDLTSEQIAEFIDIWNDLLNLLDLKVEYFLVKGDKETPISFASLIKMDSINGADLLIKIFNGNGKFLADMKITKEMFGSDFIKETGENIKETADEAKQVAKVVEKEPATKVPAKTVKGGKLPNTASDYLQNTMAGLAILLFGALVFRKVNARRA